MPRPAPVLIQTQQLLPTPLHLTSSHQIGSVLMCHNSESLTSFLPHLPLLPCTGLSPHLTSRPLLLSCPNRTNTRTHRRAPSICRLPPGEPRHLGPIPGDSGLAPDTSSPSTPHTSNWLLAVGRGDTLGRCRRRHALPPRCFRL